MSKKFSLSYPYTNTYMTMSDVRKAMDDLDKYDNIITHEPFINKFIKFSNFSQYNSQFYRDLNHTTILYHNYNYYYSLEEYVNEKARTRTSPSGHPSSYQYWKDNRTVILNEMISFGKDITDAKEVRNYLWERMYRDNIKMATGFRPENVIGILRILYDKDDIKDKDILDPFAGYGGRAIGVGASKCRSYTACDPNHRLAQGHQMIADLYPNTKYSFNYLPIEDWQPEPDARYHTIITSPPFNKREIYCDDADQSSQRYRSDEAWINFIITSMYKVWQLISEYLILYICDYGKESYCDSLIRTMCTFDDCYFLGTIGFDDCTRKKTLNPKPILIFQKRPDIPFTLRTITVPSFIRMTVDRTNCDSYHLIMSAERARSNNKTLLILTDIDLGRSTIILLLKMGVRILPPEPSGWTRVQRKTRRSYK